jgi:replicative DNA helicase
MDILHFEKKGPLINTLEQFHIYSLWKENLHLNDIYTDIHNPIFNTIINHYKQHKKPTTTPHQQKLNTLRQQHNIDSQNSNHLSVLQEHTTLHNNIVNFHVYIST